MRFNSCCDDVVQHGDGAGLLLSQYSKINNENITRYLCEITPVNVRTNEVFVIGAHLEERPRLLGVDNEPVAV